MGFSKRINKYFHSLMILYVMRRYYAKSRAVERKYPLLFRPVSRELSEKHKALWGRLGVRCGDRWLRLHVNLTGIQDFAFCPEDVFFARIERILNDCNASGMGIEDKNELWRFVPAGVEPEVVCRYIRGSFFDENSVWISEAEAEQKLSSSKEDLVGKPCRSSGGTGVRCFRWVGEEHRDGKEVLSVAWIRVQGDSYIVQRKIKQDAFSASFNPSSINTVRMMTLRCPWNGEVVVLRSMMRMGVSDLVVDNMMKGGLCVCLDCQGHFGKYAYDYDGRRFEQHPSTGMKFSGLWHPSYLAMANTAISAAARIPYYNLLSFDLVPRDDGTICIVEINATSQGITQLQYDFGGLFGPYSEKVVDWCVKHEHADQFDHLRTFY